MKSSQRRDRFEIAGLVELNPTALLDTNGGRGRTNGLDAATSATPTTATKAPLAWWSSLAVRIWR